MPFCQCINCDASTDTSATSSQKLDFWPNVALAQKGRDRRMDNLERVYHHIKNSVNESGFPATLKQMAEELNLMEHEVKTAFHQLMAAGRIAVREEPNKTIIELNDKREW